MSAKPIFMEVKRARKIFVSNSYTEFHENPTNRSVADTALQTDGRTLSAKYVVLVFTS
jgi:hypothetical protein